MNRVTSMAVVAALLVAGSVVGSEIVIARVSVVASLLLLVVAGGSADYTVKPGDTLAEIARRNGASVSDLAALNHLGSASRPWKTPTDGNDLFAPRGSEARAPVGGIVEQLIGSVGGIQFRLYGDDGHLYFGSHMDAPGHDGQVTAGTVIGYVGDSGSAAGSNPHLHFEIHPDGGITANPYPTLQANGC